MVCFWFLNGHWRIASVILVPVVISGYFLWLWGCYRNKANQSLGFSYCVEFIIHVLGCGQLIHFLRLYQAPTEKKKEECKENLRIALQYEAYYESVPSLAVTGYIVVLGIYTDWGATHVGVETWVSLTFSVASLTNFLITEMTERSLGPMTSLRRMVISLMKCAEIFQRLFFPGLVIVLFDVGRPAMVYVLLYSLTFIFHLDRFPKVFCVDENLAELRADLPCSVCSVQTETKNIEVPCDCNRNDVENVQRERQLVDNDKLSGVVNWLWMFMVIVWEVVIRTLRFQLTEDAEPLWRVEKGSSTGVIQKYRGQIISLIYLCPTFFIHEIQSNCNENCSMKFFLLCTLIVTFFIQSWQITSFFGYERREQEKKNGNGNEGDIR